MMSSDVFFCPTKGPKPKDTQVTSINDKDKEKILAFKKLGPANV